MGNTKNLDESRLNAHLDTLNFKIDHAHKVIAALDFNKRSDKPLNAINLKNLGKLFFSIIQKNKKYCDEILVTELLRVFFNDHDFLTEEEYREFIKFVAYNESHDDIPKVESDIPSCLKRLGRNPGFRKACLDKLDTILTEKRSVAFDLSLLKGKSVLNDTCQTPFSKRREDLIQKHTQENIAICNQSKDIYPTDEIKSKLLLICNKYKELHINLRKEFSL